MTRGSATALLDRAIELQTRAVAEHNHGHPIRALSILRRAQALITPSPGEAEPSAVEGVLAAILISRAYSEAEVFGAERGLVTLTEAKRHLVPPRRPEL